MTKLPLDPPLPIIDWDMCVKMSANDEAAAKELLKMLIQSLPDEHAAITTFFEQKKYIELADSIHRLHGGLCYTGLPRLKSATKELEQLVRNQAYDQLNAAFLNFSRQISDVLVAVGN